VPIGAAVAVTVTADPRPDPAAFREQVVFEVGDWFSSRHPHANKRDMAWAITHQEAVLAEGERACAWLTTQPPAPDQDPADPTDTTFEFSFVIDRYVKSTPAGSVARLSEPGRLNLTYSAWTHLCPATAEDKTA
jgi:hypothetical protein